MIRSAAVLFVVISLLLRVSMSVSIADDGHQQRLPFEFRDGDRVVLLGGTFVERAQRYGWLETALQVRFPDRKIAFRNLGWSGDTVRAESRGIFDAPEQGYQRMLTQVRELKPTVIFINYGANESFEGEAGLPSFLDGYRRLLNDLAGTKSVIVLVSPAPFLTLPSPLPDMTEARQNLAVYCDAIGRLAAEQKLRFVDLLNDIDWDKQPPMALSDNGVHFTEAGYRVLAAQFADRLLGKSPSAEVNLAADGKVRVGSLPTVKTASGTDDVVLTAEFDLPLNLQSDVLVRVTGLKPGEYKLSVNQQSARNVTSAQLAEGVRLLVSNAQMKLQTLRGRIIERDQAYFHRWRPQNVTYLFLFRKHEQGQNAREVEEFESIVSKLDDEAAVSKSPVNVRLQLRTADE